MRLFPSPWNVTPDLCRLAKLGRNAVRLVLFLCLALPAIVHSAAQTNQANVEAFHWIDFHDSKDAPTVQWVTNALKAEKWTAIREIGVQWDSAIVITALRKTPQSPPSTDQYTVWSVSLAKHDVQPLLHGVNPRILGWTTFGGAYQQAPEMGVVYDDCVACDASTYFTTLYYNFKEHAWRARWMRGDQAAPLHTAGNVEGVTQTQAYGLLADPSGRQLLGTWNHFDYGGAKPPEDFVFTYGVDPASGLEQTQALGGKDIDPMKARICHADPGQADPALAIMARGQDSPLCTGAAIPEIKGRPRQGQRITTTPPANNHGQSSPPKAIGNKPQ